MRSGPAQLQQRIQNAQTVLEAESKFVTVLVAGVAGYTASTDEPGGDQAVSVLEPLLHSMIGVVHDHGGMVTRIHGDSIMALFGAPLVQEDHAAHACRAALDIRALQENGQLAVRVGLHSGEVAVRVVRHGEFVEYDSLGSNVDLAARMEQGARPGSIRITAATQRLVAHQFAFLPLGGATMKRGAGREVESFELQGSLEPHGRYEASTQAGRRADRSRHSGSPRAGLAISRDPVRAAFQRRSLEALDRIASTAPIESLTEALAAPTDVGTLARALGDNEAVGAAVVSLEPLAPLIARNVEHRGELLAAAGGTLNASEVAALLGVSRQAADKRRRSGGLLALRQGGDWRYPRCQFDEARHDVVADLPRFVRELKIANPWIVLDLLLTPDDALGGRTPLESLRSEGWTEELARLVRIEHGDGFA